MECLEGDHSVPDAQWVSAWSAHGGAPSVAAAGLRSPSPVSRQLPQVQRVQDLPDSWEGQWMPHAARPRAISAPKPDRRGKVAAWDAAVGGTGEGPASPVGYPLRGRVGWK